MPWHEEAMKDVVNCDKPRGVVKQALLPGDFRMGQPGGFHSPSSAAEFIGRRSERREVKHLSTSRNRNQKRFP